MHLLGAENLHLSYATGVVLESVSLGVEAGDRIGVVGRNGQGKSSLMRMLAGLTTPTSGRVTRRRGVTVGVLDQADTLDASATVTQAVTAGLADHEWAAQARLREIAAGLLDGVPGDARLGELSGGQRRRVALAALLARDDDVLFLDEPTNHLDLRAVAWLAGHLRRRWTPGAGALVVVTHDRWFLDEVCTTTWEVHDGLVEPFDGGYAAYVLQRVERDRIAAATEAKRRNLMRKELAWLRRGAPARTSKPRFRIDAATRLIEDEPAPRDSVELARLATARLGKDVVDLLDADAGYGPRTVLHEVTWLIGPGERTGILGVNGAGKSTLLGLVAGTLAPTAGRVKRGASVRVSVLGQEPRPVEGGDRVVVRDLLARYKASYLSGGKEATPAQLLERLGFDREHLSAPVADLSGGQRRRLDVLLTLLAEPNVLILDEPTNDVDIDTLAALEDLLDSWPGTLIVVSHDRYLVERVTDQQYAILDGHLRHMPGGVEEYLGLVSAGGDGSRASGARAGSAAGGGRTATPSGASPTSDGAQGSGAEAGPGALSGAERRALGKEVAVLERRLARAGERAEEIAARMAAHDPTDYVGLAALTADHAAAQAEVTDLEERWLELSERLD